MESTVINRRKSIAAKILIWIFALSTLTSAFALAMRKIITYSPGLTAVERFFVTLNVPATASLVSLVTSALTFVGLLRHKRFALVTVMLFQIFGIASALTTIGLVLAIRPRKMWPWVIYNLIELVIAVVALVVVIWLREIFTAQSRRGSWKLASFFSVIGTVFTLGLAWVLLHVKHIPGKFWKNFAAVIFQGVGLDYGHHKIAQVPSMIPRLVSLSLGLTVCLAVWVFIASAKTLDSWSSAQEIEVRRLLSQYGEDDSLGYLATRRDKLLHFSPTRRSAIAYQCFGSVALASGDPIGDPSDWPAAVMSWYKQARKYGNTPAVISCSEKGAQLFSHLLGYEILRLGDEAIISPESFRIDTPGMTDVRRAARRLRRAGYVCQFRLQDETDSSELSFLDSIADSWRHGKVERGFSMALGRLGDPSDPRVVIAQVNDVNQVPVALMTFVPWGRRGISLDFMRRSPHAPNGANEFLVAELMEWCNNHSITKVSLNFAFLRQVFADAEEIDATPFEKVNSRILGFFDHFWQLQRLYRSNAKYNPTWAPRYVALPSILNLPSVAIASGRAEGFLPTLFTRRDPASEAQLRAEELAEIRSLELPPPPQQNLAALTDQERHRSRHAREFAEHGIDISPVGAVDGINLADVTPESWRDRTVCVIGRVRNIRDHGGVLFIDLQDGDKVEQFIVEAAQLGRQSLRMWARCLDCGDVIRAESRFGHSRNSTPSFIVSELTLLAKAFQPIPWRGLSDPQTRLRKRTMDMIIHPAQIDILKLRSRAIEAVRQTLLADDYVEVETPILNTIHGGATARPFRTHINAYGMDLVARIAPELALKKLVIAGMGPVFEIGRNFRNEGADATHNPEFTVVEAYRPLADYHDMRRLTQKLIQAAAIAVHDEPVMPLPVDGPDKPKRLVDISGDWPVVDVCHAVSERVGMEVTVSSDMDELIHLAQAHHIEVRPDWEQGAIIEELYAELVESQTVMPTFYADFPAETSPLTAPHRTKAGLVERWDLVAGGMELGTAYSELTNVADQRNRLLRQSWKAARGEGEAMQVDYDFLDAMALGMPPTGGLGIGLDRLVMALTDTTIRQVLAFPFVRPLPS